MATHALTLPVTEADTRKLALGDTVHLSGIVRTSRDMAHLEMRNCLDKGIPLPEDLVGGAIFHAGPVAMKNGEGWTMRVIGPTTSIRMEPYADMVGKIGVRLLIGKGGMGDASKAAFARYGQAYLQAAPGCAVRLASGVEAIERAHWLEHGMPEAMWVLRVQNFGPLVVTMDCCGNSTYDAVKENARKRIARFAAGDAG